jgi:hypothetical protein
VSGADWLMAVGVGLYCAALLFDIARMKSPRFRAWVLRLRRVPLREPVVLTAGRASVEEGEWGDPPWLLTLDGRRITSGSWNAMAEAANRINNVLRVRPGPKHD